MTSISDLPDFSEHDLLLLQNHPNELKVEKIIPSAPKSLSINITSLVSEDNLVIFIIIFIIMYKPTSNYIQMFSPFSNDLANVVFKSSCIVVIYILFKMYFLPHLII